jgi:hypothetical protein
MASLELHHGSWSQGMEELKKINRKALAALSPLQKAENDAAYFGCLRSKVIPALQMWRDDLRGRRQEFLESGTNLRNSVDQVVAGFEQRAAADVKRVPTLRTELGHKQLTQVVEGLKKTATEYKTYKKDIGKNEEQILHLLDYCEDVGPVLESLDLYAKGVIDVATKKGTVEGSLKELKAFLDAVTESLIKSLERGEPKLPPIPGVPPKVSSLPSVLPGQDKTPTATSAVSANLSDLVLPARAEHKKQTPSGSEVNSPERIYALAVAAVDSRQWDLAERYFNQLVGDQSISQSLRYRAQCGLAHVNLSRT